MISKMTNRPRCAFSASLVCPIQVSLSTVMCRSSWGRAKARIRAGGRLLVIDGGLSRAYQPVTGIAGYTLIFTSHELNLVAHQPFESTAAAISAEQDIHSVQSLVKQMPRRLLIDDTDEGEDLRCRIDDLMRLITAYRKGVIKEARG